ncbi:MAG: M6 family metalloprotease domain-containing protein [Bacteroidales bacterium]|nr:M6 family metalloprotease domain-containing protein [Bacteroidales bacterium]
MKKTIMTVMALVCAAQVLSAIPARPDKFTRILPDGRKITLQLHGDEFRHWMTDESGRVVREDRRGNIVPSSMAEAKVHMGGSAAVNRERMQRIEKMKRMMRNAVPTRSSDGSLHFPMILVQFSDLKFQVAETDELVWEAFNNLANEVGYSANGGTGSIHDYYVDNSMNQTDFYFDVFGPVTVSGTYADYGAHKQSEVMDYSGEPAAEALMEAVRLVAAEKGGDIFNPYDNDGDGWVDAVFMYYAGHNQAEGGPEDTIWPHEWSVGSYDYCFGTHHSEEVFGNVRFGTYSCSSELKGSSGSEMCGIGTAVHEFGHALGLPDLYDTSYNDYGDGECGGVYSFSPMCGGSYNNGSRTPACFTMEERVMMGWAAGFEPMPAAGSITIPALSTSNTAYKEETGNPGEYFVFECRNGKGWDRYVPKGMVVYHVDKSANEVVIYTDTDQSYTTTAGGVWNDRWGINTNLEHPCYYVVPAADQGNLNYWGSASAIPFPGNYSVKTYQWQGWAPDNAQGDQFYKINYNNSKGEVTMFRDGVNTAVAGNVADTDGNPVAGATVCVYAEYRPATVTAPSQAAPAVGPARVARHVGNPLRTVQTDAEGFYKIDLEDLELSGDVTVVVSAPGYVSKTEHVTLTSRAVVTRNSRLLRVGEPTYGALAKYDGESVIGILGFASEEIGIRMGAIRFTAEELSAYVGKKIVGLDFMYYVADERALSGVKGIIDFGETRLIAKDVPDPVSYVWNHLDLSEEDIRIPEDTDCCFGYALLGCSEPYPYCYSSQAPAKGGMLLYEPEDPSGSIPEEVEWWDYSEDFGPLAVAVILENGTVLQFNYIANPSASTYAVGQTLDLNLVRVDNDHAPGTDVSWYFDDEPVSGKVTFTRAGRHTLEARFTTVAGRRKIVELEITVE